jgi:hypothetical protein
VFAATEHLLGQRVMQAGRSIFVALAHTQLTLILLIVPAHAAGAITMEREKRTLEMLRATLVSASDIVTGKLFVILAFGLLLLVTSLPVASWCVLLGGMAPVEVAFVYSYLLAVAFFAAALGMVYSVRMGRSMGAVVATYGTLIAISVLSVMVPIIVVEVLLGGPSSKTALGSEGAFWVVSAFLAVAAWLVFVLARAVAARVLAGRRRWMPTAVGLTIGLGLLAVAVVASEPIVVAVSRVDITAFVILNPYAALAALMEGQMARTIVFGSPGPGSATTGFQFELWAIATAIFLLFALALWGGATTALSRRQE